MLPLAAIGTGLTTIGGALLTGAGSVVGSTVGSLAGSLIKGTIGAGASAVGSVAGALNPFGGDDDNQKENTAERITPQSTETENRFTGMPGNAPAVTRRGVPAGQSRSLSLRPSDSRSATSQKINPAVAILASIRSTLSTISTNVSSLLKFAESENVRSEDQEGRRIENRLEDERREDQENAQKKPGFISRTISKVGEKGVGGLIGLLIKGVAFFFGISFLKKYMDKNFPTLMKPINEFLGQFGSLFTNLKNSITNLFEGDTEQAMIDGKAALKDGTGLINKAIKFLSTSIDKLLNLAGFESLRLYEKGLSFFQDQVKPRYDAFIKDIKSYFSNLQGETTMERIGETLEDVIVTVLASIRNFVGKYLTFDNLSRIYQKSSLENEKREQLSQLPEEAGTDEGLQKVLEDQIRSNRIAGEDSNLGLDELRDENFQKRGAFEVLGKNTSKFDPRLDQLNEEQLEILRKLELKQISDKRQAIKKKFIEGMLELDNPEASPNEIQNMLQRELNPTPFNNNNPELEKISSNEGTNLIRKSTQLTSISTQNVYNINTDSRDQKQIVTNTVANVGSRGGTSGPISVENTNLDPSARSFV